MSDRYSDDQLERMRSAADALKRLTADGTLRDFLIGKLIFLEDAIIREGKAREADRKAADASPEALAKGEAAAAPPDPAPEPAPDPAPPAATTSDENPPT